MYVPNSSTDDVSVIDSATNTVVDTIDAGRQPNNIEFNPSNTNIYVTNRDSDDVSVIDSATNAVVDTIDVGGQPNNVEYNPSNNMMYVTNYESNTVSIIDSTTNLVVDTVPVGVKPYAILFNPSNNDVYVANQGSGTVSVIGTDQSASEPTADAGPDQTVQSRDIVQFDGSNSSDPNGSSLTYSWNQTSGPEVNLSDSTSSKPTFVAPETNEPIVLTFILTVTNAEGTTSEPDEVTITVNPTPIVLQPVSDAGPDQSVQSRDIVQLDGSNSSDSNGSPLTHAWAQIGGPAVALSDSSSPTPTFTAPEVTDQTDLTFQLTVTNEEGTVSEPDEVIITINPISQPPPEEPRTIGDLIKGIIKNPLDMTNSIDSANQIRDILTDDNPDNDQIVCDLLESEDENTSNIREILNC